MTTTTTSSAWWPEITVDVIESDIRKFFGNIKPDRGNEMMGQDEDEIECDWEIISSLDNTNHTSRFENFRELEKKMKSQQDRVILLQHSMCSATFNMMMAEMELYPGKINTISPLNFCHDTFCFGEENVDGSIDLTLFGINISKSVQNHASLFLSDPPSFISQDTKDIQRDSVCLNGQLLVGSECGGYSTILDALVECITAGGLHGDDEWEDVETLGQVVLSIANRTFSGGIAFDEILKNFPSLNWLVSPISNEAQPLDIIISGSRAFVRAHTRYLVIPGDCQDPENAEDKRRFDSELFVDIPLVAVTQQSRAHLFIRMTSS